MKWIDNWILKRMRLAAASETANESPRTTPISNGYYSKVNNNSGLITKGNGLQSEEKSIRFSVYNANGGRIVETRKIDPTRARELTGLYVMTSDQDFGHEIDKIITLESLKNG